MNKTIVKVFVIIGILLIALLVWAFVFGDGLATIFNAVIDPINGIYQSMTGSSGYLIPRWSVASANNLAAASDTAW